MVRVVTYNVLSPALAPGHAPHSPDAFLASAHRLPLLLRALAPEVSSLAVICLQEVATAWAGPLHAFFAASDYHLITASYGSRRNGFMGVALAFPTRHFELLAAEVTCVSDTKCPPPPPPPLQPVLPAPAAPLAPAPGLGSSAAPSSASSSTWDAVRGRVNQLISVRLRARAGAGDGAAAAFCVSTYHMPCLFMDRPVMTVHCALAAQAAHAFADGARYILAGDFNIKPGDAQYELFTRGASEREAPPPEFEGDAWRPTLAAPLASAYAQAAGGREPPFTNYAQHTEEAEPFIDTLDYIFLSRGWRVVEVKPLPSAAEIASPMPTEHQPSDHLLLAATLAPVPL